jgi:hypothetical protein
MAERKTVSGGKIVERRRPAAVLSELTIAHLSQGGVGQLVEKHLSIIDAAS